jgi:hypothetical protein
MESCRSGRDALAHKFHPFSRFGKPIRLDRAVLDLIAQELARRVAARAFAMKANLLCPPIGPGRFRIPVRTGREEHYRIPKRIFTCGNLRPMREPFAERMILRQHCKCLTYVVLKVVLNKCDARAPLRIVEMASTAGRKAPRHAAGLALVVTRKHWQPHEVNANVRASTGLDDFFLHRTGAVQASPSRWRQHCQDAQFVLVGVELLAQRLDGVAQDGHAQGGLARGFVFPV